MDNRELVKRLRDQSVDEQEKCLLILEGARRLRATMDKEELNED